MFSGKSKKITRSTEIFGKQLNASQENNDMINHVGIGYFNEKLCLTDLSEFGLKLELSIWIFIYEIFKLPVFQRWWRQRCW